MSTLTRLIDHLGDTLGEKAFDMRVVRENELHLRLAAGTPLALASTLEADFDFKLSLMVASDRRTERSCFEISYLFASARENLFVHATKDVPASGNAARSIATFSLPASLYEREIRDMFGILFEDHPNERPLVRHGFWPEDYFPLRKDAARVEFADNGQSFPFQRVGGEGVFEIPVGPVHAGIIEPGHFRFSVVGETIIDMKARLYFTHKGTEKLFEGRTPAEALPLSERISGDTTVGHAMAYCQAIESLAGVDVPNRARYFRVVLLEMERLYNHIADFGAIANDTGFAVANSHCMRIRERLLRLNAELTGNRLLRDGIVPGGVAATASLSDPARLAGELDSVLADFEEVVEICMRNSLLVDRLEGTGRLTRKTAEDHGVLGYIARSCGIDVDTRRDHPFAAYGKLEFRVPVLEEGDVKARALLRVEEVRESVSLIKQAAPRSTEGLRSVLLRALPAFEPAFGLVEGWRGQIIHWVMADEEGRLTRVKIKDPSFVNWRPLSFALLKNIVPDFPLCNKSFNQSYSGNDL